MPVDMVMKAGFGGASVIGSSQWFGQHAADNNVMSVMMPFMGAGRHLSAICRPGVLMESWDTQIYGRCVIDGIFAAKTFETNIDEPRFRKGMCYYDRLFKGMDDYSAGLFDYIATHGTLLDKACIYSATIKQTYRMRLTEWSERASVHTLWKAFCDGREAVKPYINMPGIWKHHEGNFFTTDYPGDRDPVPEYDVLMMDPPKIIGSADIYWKTYAPINRALGGHMELDRWNWQDYMGRMRLCLDIPSKWIYFLYVTEVRPDWNTIRRMLEGYGEIVQEETWQHRRRMDYTVVVKRH